jgi:iron complex transport system substrate-binding protein
MRIASLAPAATEWIHAFGAGDGLVARSHACDFPEVVLALPSVTSSGETSGSGWPGNDVVSLDHERLAALAPDLTVVPASVSEHALPGFDLAVERFEMGGRTMKEILAGALRLARRIGRLPEAMAFIGENEAALQALRRRIGASRDGLVRGAGAPRAVLLEWIDPPVVAGLWAPDLIELAGGADALASRGEASRAVLLADVEEADPDVLVLAPRGRAVPETLGDLSGGSARMEWQKLRAVRNGRAFVLDGRVFVHTPGPRLYRTIELLAAALHPENAGIVSEPWEMQPLRLF